MSIRIKSLNVCQPGSDVSYSISGPVRRVLVGPKQIQMDLETDGPFPFPEMRGYATLEDWFIDNIVPMLSAEQLRRIVTKATVQLLNPNPDVVSP